MNKHRFKWLGLVVLSLATLLVTGCGGGGGTSAPPVAKVAGTVSFPTSASLSMGSLAKLASKSVAAEVAPTYGVPTVTLRNLAGAVVATATVSGTTPGPYTYTFTNVPMGVDYVVKASYADKDYVLKALIDKNALIPTTTKNLNAVTTTSVVLTEQKLGAAPGTLGDSANAVVTTSAIATVNPLDIESQINSAISAGVTADNYKLINLTNVLTATVFNNVNTASFIAGTLADSTITTTQYTSTGVASIDVPVVSSAVPAVLTAVAAAIITQPVVVTPPATTDSVTASVFKSGMYYLDYNWNETTQTEFIYASKISLTADGLHLTETYQSFLDPISKVWTTTQPTSFPGYTDNEYALTSSGWIQGADNVSNDIPVINSDGSVTITNALSGTSAKVTVTVSNMAGEAVNTDDSSGLPLVTSPAVFPAGSLGYAMTWNQLNDSYSLWDEYGGMLGTDLTKIPAMFPEGITGQSIYLPSNEGQFYAKFVTTSSTGTVNVYQVGSSSPITTLPYAITTVLGKQILEISIPSTFRDVYKLAGNPIFSLAPTGVIMFGVHETPGISYNNGSGGYNEIAINHIKASINTSLAKPVLAKKISKSILGF